MDPQLLARAREALAARQAATLRPSSRYTRPRSNCCGGSRVTGTVDERSEAAAQPATLVAFREGRVARMRQFRSREEALAAATAEEAR